MDEKLCVWVWISEDDVEIHSESTGMTLQNDNLVVFTDAKITALYASGGWVKAAMLKPQSRTE